MPKLAGGIPGDESRRLLEAVSAGNVRSGPIADIAREGFLAGLNEVLVLGAGLALAGALPTLWLVRENEIERASRGSP